MARLDGTTACMTQVPTAPMTMPQTSGCRMFLVPSFYLGRLK